MEQTGKLRKLTRFLSFLTHGVLFICLGIIRCHLSDTYMSYTKQRHFFKTEKNEISNNLQKGDCNVYV